MELYSISIQVVLVILLLGSIGIVGTSSNPVEGSSNTGQNRCVDYDSAQKLIEVLCKSIHLTDIYNSLLNSSILSAEDDEKNSDDDDNPAKVWILNAGIVIDKQGSLVIDSSDTSWLKIIPTPTIQKQKLANITKNSNFSNHTNLIQTDSNNTSTTSNIPKGTVAVSKIMGITQTAFMFTVL